MQPSSLGNQLQTWDCPPCNLKFVQLQVLHLLLRSFTHTHQNQHQPATAYGILVVWVVKTTSVRSPARCCARPCAWCRPRSCAWCCAHGPGSKRLESHKFWTRPIEDHKHVFVSDQVYEVWSCLKHLIYLNRLNPPCLNKGESVVMSAISLSQTC